MHLGSVLCLKRAVNRPPDFRRCGRPPKTAFGNMSPKSFKKIEILKSCKSDSRWKTYARWTSHFHDFQIVAHFHIELVLLTRNFFEQTHVIKVAVLLNEFYYYTSVMVQTRGKPPTWFPRVKLVKLSVHQFFCFGDMFRNCLHLFNLPEKSSQK